MTRFISTTLATTLIALVILTASSARADVAANTRIVNNATVSFNDGTGTFTVTASVAVTVELVAALPNWVTPPDTSTPYTGPNTLLTFDYTITAASNGPDTYTLGATVFSSTNTTSPAVSLPASVTLGASITTSDTGNVLSLQVPSDGSAADNEVNGITAGDRIVVDLGSGPEAVNVQSVSDPGGSGLATITLAGSTPLSISAPAGTAIFEQQTFTLTVDSGTIVTAGMDITVTADVTATNSAGTLTDQVLATFTSVTTSLTKYVRNVFNASGNSSGTGAQAFTVQGFTGNFFTGGVTAESGDTLEYLLVASNSGSIAATSASISDVLPTTFVVFANGSYTTDDLVYIDEGGTENLLTLGGQATLTGSNLSVNVGTGASAAAGGSISTGNTISVAYRVIVN